MKANDTGAHPVLRRFFLHCRSEIGRLGTLPPRRQVCARLLLEFQALVKLIDSLADVILDLPPGAVPLQEYPELSRALCPRANC